jgi:hypothetical protein
VGIERGVDEARVRSIKSLQRLCWILGHGAMTESGAAQGRIIRELVTYKQKSIVIVS